MFFSLNHEKPNQISLHDLTLAILDADLVGGTMPKVSKLVVAEDCAGLGPLLPCCKFLGLNPIQ